MICPKCHSYQTLVIDSREHKNGYAIRRRRECQRCGHRFTTFETIGTEIETDLKATRALFRIKDIVDGVIK